MSKETEIHVQQTLVRFTPHILFTMLFAVASGAFYAGSELQRINTNLEKVVGYMHRTEKIEKSLASICSDILHDHPNKRSILACDP